ncbi:cyclin-U4-1 [Tripterygium wilfordii]|uniref:Cyclin-U4-1 n=1 Tax=Tripterygium wilfordii TaxID=458696 RepID=A0A7J7CDM3_TRIWF|nr:cyclin-U4-1-like [Tripterygium wilfordii]KAF5732271.1 cyclin-U4-1 [Tripterygium wilfordii]
MLLFKNPRLYLSIQHPRFFIYCLISSHLQHSSLARHSSANRAYVCLRSHNKPTNQNNNNCSKSAMADLQETMVMPKAISFLSTLLQRVAESNDLNRRVQSLKISVFHGLTRPPISIQSYLERIFKYANCSQSCFVVAYVYLDRFAQKQPSLPINSFNVHRLLITSVLVSAKFMDDIYYDNAYYAKVGGISTTEMNLLELDFLFGLGFELNVTPNTFQTYCSFLQREMLMQSPPQLAVELEPPLHELKHLHCFNEDDSTTHQKQLAV